MVRTYEHTGACLVVLTFHFIFCIEFFVIYFFLSKALSLTLFRHYFINLFFGTFFFSFLSVGFTEINLTKLDVLSGFPEIKIGRKYMLNGQEVKGMPSSLKDYSDIKVDFEVMPGWTEDVSNIKNFEDLPANCRAYVLRLEELIGVPIR